MSFIILPEDAKEVQLSKELMDGAISYEIFKIWRDKQKDRNRNHGNKNGMNFADDSIVTLFQKETFNKLLRQENITYDHIGIFFGSQKGALIPGIGNFKKITAFLTLANTYNDKIIPVGEVYRGDKDAFVFSNENQLIRFKEQYKNRILTLREIDDDAKKDYNLFEMTGIYHKLKEKEDIRDLFLGRLTVNQVKVIFVKDDRKTTVVFAPGNFDEQKDDLMPDTAPLLYDQGTGCCPIEENALINKSEK